MLLSRTAESLYWAARYLERAEDTARVAREHTNLLVDIPVSVSITWEPLLAITGSHDEFDERFTKVDESTIIRFLVADEDNPGSIVASVEGARENLRTTREVLPREVWQAVNDLHLYVQANHDSGVARATRAGFLDRVIGEVQRVGGILGSTMSRDAAYEFLRLGRNIERADMTTRVLDVRASALLAGGPMHEYDDVQWMSVLRSVSGLQMYHRATRRPIEGDSVVTFLLTDQAFPRSVGHCMGEMLHGVEQLPRHELVQPACEAALAMVRRAAVDATDGAGLHEAMDRLQIAVAEVHDAVASAYFLRATS